MIVIIDNYDSFTYNLYQYIGEINPDVKVYRNDKITVEEIKKLMPSHIVISPGPGYPKDAGITIELIKKLSGNIPILGICLGHQAIGEAFGGEVIRAKELMHGKSSEVILGKTEIFRSLPKKIKAGRYHSLVINPDNLPKQLEIIAETDDRVIMGVKHKEYPTFGIQFHPESILTESGMEIIENFLNIKKTNFLENTSDSNALSF
ncbi:MAG: anthranilate synthase component II [Ignavibacteriales bacterium]